MGARVGIERPCVGGEEVVDGVHEGVGVGEAGELASRWRLLDLDLVSVLPIDRVLALGPIEREGVIELRHIAAKGSTHSCRGHAAFWHSLLQ